LNSVEHKETEATPGQFLKVLSNYHYL